MSAILGWLILIVVLAGAMWPIVRPRKYPKREHYEIDYYFGDWKF